MVLSSDVSHTPFRALLCGFLAALMCGPLFGACSSAGPLPERIRSSDASFTAVFPPCFAGGDPVVCRGEKTGGTVTLTVVTPERSAGVRIEADPLAGTCTLFTAENGDPIPVDPTAAAGILAPLALLCGPAAEDAPVFSRADDGEVTRIESSAGTLVVTPSGIPVRLIAPDFAGHPREIAIEAWTAMEGGVGN